MEIKLDGLVATNTNTSSAGNNYTPTGRASGAGNHYGAGGLEAAPVRKRCHRDRSLHSRKNQRANTSDSLRWYLTAGDAKETRSRCFPCAGMDGFYFYEGPAIVKNILCLDIKLTLPVLVAGNL